MKNTLLLLMFTLLGCSNAPTVKSWLDPVSSATITAQIEPLIVARDDPSRPIDERDFAQLTAVEINRMGERRLYLVAIPWSSENRARSEREKFEDSFARVELRIDDRSVALERHQGEIEGLGVGESTLPLPIPGSRQFFFRVERADLQALVNSTRVQLIAQGQSESPQSYQEWQDGRRALGDFLSQLPNDSTSSGR